MGDQNEGDRDKRKDWKMKTLGRRGREGKEGKEGFGEVIEGIIIPNAEVKEWGGIREGAQKGANTI